MARTTGDAPFSANFEVRKAAPLDARSIVGTRAALTELTTWDGGDGNAYVYKGMPVSVINDGINNGIYRLAEDDYTNPDNWVKVGEGGNGGGGSGDPIFPYRRNFVEASWDLEGGVYTLTNAPETHGKVNTKHLVCFVYESDTDNESVLAKYTVSNEGTVKVYSEAPFDGYLMISDLVGAVSSEAQGAVVNSNLVSFEVEQDGHGFNLDSVYYDDADEEWKLARADDEFTLATHFAIAIDTDKFLAVQIGKVIIDSILDVDGNPLEPKTSYYLSQSEAGKLTKEFPTDGYRQLILQTIDAEIGTVYNDPALLYFKAPKLHEETINFNAASGTVYIPSGLPIGTKRVVRKVHEGEGEVEIQFTGNEKTLKGELDKLSLHHLGNYWTLEKVTQDRWDIKASFPLNAIFYRDADTLVGSDDLRAINICNNTYFNNIDELITPASDGKSCVLKKGFTYKVKFSLGMVIFTGSGNETFRGTLTNNGEPLGRQVRYYSPNSTTHNVTSDYVEIVNVYAQEDINVSFVIDQITGENDKIFHESGLHLIVEISDI